MTKHNEVEKKQNKKHFPQPHRIITDCIRHEASVIFLLTRPKPKLI